MDSTRRTWKPILLNFLLVCATSGVAAAQYGRDSQYRPARPTMSPYVGLLQGNNGAIPNYYSLVRPRLEQRAFNQQLQNTERIQSLDIQSLSSGNSQDMQTASPTGKHAGFEQYLHYYPSLQVGGSRRR